MTVVLGFRVPQRASLGARRTSTTLTLWSEHREHRHRPRHQRQASRQQSPGGICEPLGAGQWRSLYHVRQAVHRLPGDRDPRRPSANRRPSGLRHSRPHRVRPCRARRDRRLPRAAGRLRQRHRRQASDAKGLGAARRGTTEACSPRALALVCSIRLHAAKRRRLPGRQRDYVGWFAGQTRRLRLRARRLLVRPVAARIHVGRPPTPWGQAVRHAPLPRRQVARSRTCRGDFGRPPSSGRDRDSRRRPTNPRAGRFRQDDCPGPEGRLSARQAPRLANCCHFLHAILEGILSASHFQLFRFPND